VTMSYIDMPRGLRVTFMEGIAAWPRCNFTDDRKIFELLRRSYAPIEDYQIVEMALRRRRLGVVERRWVIRGRWRWSAPKNIARQRASGRTSKPR
jgi:hypothetical protein